MESGFHTARFLLSVAPCKLPTSVDRSILAIPDYEEELILPRSGLRKDAHVPDSRETEAHQAPRVLIVEDERRLASLLKQQLTDLKLSVEMVHDGESGLQTALDRQFDLVILDVMLPGQDGFAVCRELRRRGLTLPIMILSARGVLEDRVRGLDSGADDYLTKPFEFAELSARVRALLRRQRPAAALSITVGDLTLDPVSRSVRRGERKVDLTQKEFLLLEYFMRNVDQVLTRSMIGERVWDFTWDRMTNVIDVYVNHLRRKLEDAGERRMIHAVRGVGYVLRSSEQSDDQDT
jgi:DNA-binding response OmpR family regulator